MILEDGLQTFLVANAGVAALVIDRVQPFPLPQESVMPAITYRRIDAPRMMAHDGPTGFATARIQCDCWGKNYSQAKRTANAVRKACDGYVGLMGSVEIHETEAAGDIDDYEPQVELYRTVIDLVILHMEQDA